VAGLIGAVRNNKYGIDGVADNVRIMGIKAVPNGDEYDKDIANAIHYAVDNGAKVINMSFGKKLSPHKDGLMRPLNMPQLKMYCWYRHQVTTTRMWMPNPNSRMIFLRMVRHRCR
jgi:hypothetical protein